MKTEKHIDLASNAFRAVQAWKFAAIALAAVSGVLATALVYQARNLPMVLVPHDLATFDKTMKVPLNGQLRGTSHEYLSNVALGDLSLILNFTPDDVVTQHRRFLNRLTESLHGRQRETLMAQAEDFRKRAVTQSFFPSNVKVSSDFKKVEVTGTQLRWVGGKESVRASVTYTITYDMFKGYLHIADLRQQTDKAESPELNKQGTAQNANN